jgi:hypothetical protein
VQCPRGVLSGALTWAYPNPRMTRTLCTHNAHPVQEDFCSIRHHIVPELLHAPQNTRCSREDSCRSVSVAFPTMRSLNNKDNRRSRGAAFSHGGSCSTSVLSKAAHMQNSRQNQGSRSARKKLSQQTSHPKHQRNQPSRRPRSHLRNACGNACTTCALNGTARSTQYSTQYSTLHTAHCTLHTAHCTLHTAHCTLHTAHCTLHDRPPPKKTKREEDESVKTAPARDAVKA